MTNIPLQCACFLQNLVHKYKSLKSEGLEENDKYKIFDHKSTPAISLVDFSIRVNHKLQCSECNNILAVALIEKALKINAGLSLTIFNIHKIYLSALIITCMIYDDDFNIDKETCYSMGINFEEANFLITKFFELIDLNAYISRKDYLRISRIIGNDKFYKIHSTNESYFHIKLVYNSGESIL